MTDAEIIVYNAGKRLFDDANEPVADLIRNEIWPSDWLTVPETQAARKLTESDRWKWLRKGWYEAAWDDASDAR